MTFKDQIIGAIDEALADMEDNPLFSADSMDLAYRLADDLRESLAWESGDDSGAHNAVSEEMKIFLSHLRPHAVMPSALPAYFYLVLKISELLHERNEQIYFNDVMGGTNV